MVLFFLSAVGLLYLALAIWCTVDPANTSSKVGLTIQPGSGQSEFLTVYGGLEFGLGLVLLIPWFYPQSTRQILLACLLIHGSLVLFRTAGFLVFSGITGMTWRLAAGEWVIFLIALGLWLQKPLEQPG